MTRSDDPLDLDEPGAPLTPDEREHIRGLLRDDDRATWARKKIMVLVPIIVGGVTLLYQLVDWARLHVSLK